MSRTSVQNKQPPAPNASNQNNQSTQTGVKKFSSPKRTPTRHSAAKDLSVWRQACFIMAPKTGSKKLVETRRPQRDLDCANAEGGHAWLARSFDLKSAYRQCAVHHESRQFSHIVVGDPNTLSLKVFRLKALPFGSVKSVHRFLRIPHSLLAILTSAFW